MANVETRPEYIVRAERIINTINRVTSWISYFAISAMMVFVFCDVILRYLGHPTSGSNDIVQAISVTAVAFAMGYTQVLKRYPSVSFFVDHLPRRTQELIAPFANLLGLVPIILLAWMTLPLARNLWVNNEGTMTLGIPMAPLVYSITVGSILMSLVLLVDFIVSLYKAVQR